VILSLSTNAVKCALHFYRITFLLVSNWLIYREIIDYLEKYHKLHP